MQNFNQAIQRFQPLFGPPVQPSIRPTIQPTVQPPVQPPVQPIRPTIMPTTAPTETPLITPKDSSIARIQNVFGEGWHPSAAFTPELQGRGIYGAVRVENTDDVYTIGPGGSKETPVSYQEKFGTLAQEDIVGIVTPEQATRLGIVTPSIPVAPMEKAAAEIETEELPEKIPEELLPEPEPGELPEELPEELPFGKLPERQRVPDNRSEEQIEEEKLSEEEIDRIIENPQGENEISLAEVFVSVMKNVAPEIAKQVVTQFALDLAGQSIEYLFDEYLRPTNKRVEDCERIAEDINKLYANGTMILKGEDKESLDALVKESGEIGCEESGLGLCGICGGRKPETIVSKSIEQAKKSYVEYQQGIE